MLPRAGRLVGRAGAEDEAFRLIEGWVQRQPTLADAKVELARLNEEYGDRRAAKDLLIEALAADPNNARALTALGKIREEAGDKAQALANYQRSLDIDNRQTLVASRVMRCKAAAAAELRRRPSRWALASPTETPPRHGD